MRSLPDVKIDVIESGSSVETVRVHAEDELELVKDEGVHVDIEGGGAGAGAGGSALAGNHGVEEDAPE